ncbi:hypothetical protein B0H14DRAFT_3500923 [Mycena olivaceomarginata]|nr:hypothetical protein B0H14DRAFT_3500923 [Mycena olivaceomarginata]
MILETQTPSKKDFCLTALHLCTQVDTRRTGRHAPHWQDALLEGRFQAVQEWLRENTTAVKRIKKTAVKRVKKTAVKRVKKTAE